MKTLSRQYGRIWLALMGLVALSIVFRLLSFPPRLNAGLVFGVAGVKAVLVTRNYMHLKDEGWLPWLAVASPIFLLLCVVVACAPDLSWVASTRELMR